MSQNSHQIAATYSRNVLSDLLDVGSGVLLVDGLGGDGAPPPDGLHNVRGKRRLGILRVIWGQEGGLGFLRGLLEKDLISISQEMFRVCCGSFI